MRVPITLLAVLLIPGCADPGYDPATGGATPSIPDARLLTTNAGRYVAGSRATFQLQNRTAYTVGYNLCQSRLERQHDGDWSVVMNSLGEACTMELRDLRPGQAVTYTFRIADGIKDGDYRIATPLVGREGRTRFDAVSNIFRLTRTSD